MFTPLFVITPRIAKALIHLEAIRQEINYLPITPTVLATLRETAQIDTIHYSTMIEGNQLSQQEVAQAIISRSELFLGRERDRKEALGYHVALDYIERLVTQKSALTQEHVQMLHALVMAGGKKRVKPTPYRDGQNCIRDSTTNCIVYLPPEPFDVPLLMVEFVDWVNSSQIELPCPLRAGMAHYQYTTIHPHYDGNGRAARLLTTLILHLGGYDLKGLYSLEEYYAKDLLSYYRALSVGPSHNYYMGRAESDITSWIEYFCLGMVESFESVKYRAMQAHNRGARGRSIELKALDHRQRTALGFFQKHLVITSKDIEELFVIKPRTARALCQHWVREGFLITANLAKRNRKYKVAERISQIFVTQVEGN
jgi:Fic family protein